MTSRRMTSPTMQFILPSLLAALVFVMPSAAAKPGTYLHVWVEPSGKVTQLGVTPPSEVVYSNEQTTFDPNGVPQNGEEWADFLHCSHGGLLTGFGAGFNGIDPDNAPIGAGVNGSPSGDYQVSFTLYEAGIPTVGLQSSGDTPGLPILGPWTFDVPAGTVGISVSFAPFMTIAQDLWMGVKFSDPTIGLTRNDPPSIGSSEDWFHNVDQNSKGDFAGNPVANFVMTVQIEGPVSVEPTTWGRIKTLIGSGNQE